MRVQFLSAIILVMSINSQASIEESKGATVITVGSAGSSCDITTGTTKIQDAIDSNFSDIHVVNTETYNENIIINDKSITIIGGFTSCANAAAGIQTPNEKSIIDGSANTLSTIRIFGNTFINSVELDSLEITGGTSNGLGGGGILAFGADVEIILNDNLIHNNVGRFGGGIAMIGADRMNLFVTDTVIKLNQATESGGGLYCNYTGTGIAPQLVFSTNTGISGNGATNGSGGGVFLNTCDFHFASGDNDISLDFGINRNLATMQGGGIYAEDEATIDLIGNESGCGLICTGDNTKPVTIAGNTAQGNGGGIFLTGFNTQINMNMVLLAQNTSASNGGGMAIANNAELNVTRSQKSCWNEDHCNFFIGNKSGENSGLGGLLYNTGAIANINQSEIALNRADFGTVLYTVGSNSLTTFIGCVIRDNGGIRVGTFPHDDRNVFRVAGNAQVDVYHSTIADNLADVAVFGIVDTAGAVSEIHNSIVSDASTGTLIEPFVGSQSLVDFRKCLLHEKASLELPTVPDRNDLATNDPLFVNRVANNYHIDPLNSPARDFAANDHSFFKDMDFEDRGVDFPEINDFFGPYDVGADEAQRPDAMFSDGFEN